MTETAVDPASLCDVPLPRVLRSLVNLPWPLKQRIVSSRFAWRCFAGVCRRVGWDARRLGWHTPVNGPYAGIRLRATHPNNLWVPMGTYEPATSQWIVRLLREPQWDCVGKDVWDVGAYRGYTSLLCARHGQGRVLSFEPDPTNLENLRVHLQGNPILSARIEVLPVAVSDADEEIDFHSWDSGSESQMVKTGVALWDESLQTPRTVCVRAVRMDSVLESGRPAPGLVKIDVEAQRLSYLQGRTRCCRTIALRQLSRSTTPARDAPCARVWRTPATLFGASPVAHSSIGSPRRSPMATSSLSIAAAID